MKRELLIACLAATCALPLAAHEGHDHGDEKAALPNLGNTPQRLADGVVFLPKAAQRQLGVLTVPVAAAAEARAIELPGQVVVDPQRGGRVQAMLAGRIEAGPKGLPAIGSRVRKGEVLAWVVPAAGQLERADLAAQLAETQAARQLAEKRLARLRELADTVPGKDIEAAESELASLKGRIAALGHGVSGRDALVAPVAGVVAAANAVVGQVVDAREVVFEIVDPDGLQVEALAYEALAPGEVLAATVGVGERSVELAFLGAARRLREQALPLQFGQRGDGLGLLLPLGQPVKIQVKLKSTVNGWPVPQRALVRSAANVAMVWVKTAPERFTPKPVRSQPLDGGRVLVTDGLADGDRVVVDGATLINQIR
jgi:hypothetical protein